LIASQNQDGALKITCSIGVSHRDDMIRHTQSTKDRTLWYDL